MFSVYEFCRLRGYGDGGGHDDFYQRVKRHPDSICLDWF